VARVRTAALMNKGLRPTGDIDSTHYFALLCPNSCPDEQGIETAPIAYVGCVRICLCVRTAALMNKGSRPALIRPHSKANTIRPNSCPDEQGIETENIAANHFPPEPQSEQLP